MTLKSIFITGLLMLAATAAQAHDYKLGSLEIAHPWSRATPKGAGVGAGYVKITNSGAAPDRLIGVASPIAGRAEIHEMATVDGVMTMRPIKGGLEIKPGETVELKPGSFHIMLQDLKQPIVAGEPIKGTLTFEKAGSQDVEFVVESIGGMPMGADNADHMHH